MDTGSNWKVVFVEAFSSFGEKVLGILPGLLGALILLLIGWLTARVVSKLVRRILVKIGFNKVGQILHLQKFLEEANIRATPAKLIASAFYWIIMLIFLMAATEILGWKILSREFGELVAYLPSLISGIILLLLGVILAQLIRDAVYSTAAFGIDSARLLGSIIYYVLLVIVVIAALDQAQISTAIITSNVLIIIGAFLLSFALAYGLATRDILGNMFASFAIGNKFQVGQDLGICGIRGKISSIGSMYLTIRTKEGTDHVFPVKCLIMEEVELYKG